MFHSFCRIVGIVCFVICLYMGWQWWNGKPTPLRQSRSPITKIIIANGDGTETVIQVDGENKRRVYGKQVLNLDVLSLDGEHISKPR